MERDALSRLLAFGQGAYFLATGAWALLHLPSFLFVTGPKNDLWLVQTVGVLVAAIGLALLLAAGRDRVTLETRVLAVTSALGLAAVETWYALAGSIRGVYLLDALLELALIALWAVASLGARRAVAAPA